MIRLLKKYLKDFKWELLGTVFFTVVSTFIQVGLFLPESKRILDKGVARGDLAFIWQSGGKMLLITLAIAVVTLITSYLSARITAAITCRIRSDCYNKVTSFSSQDFAHFGESTLLSRTMADITQMSTFIINLLRSSMSVPIVVICLLIMISRINLMMFGILLISFVITVIYMVYNGAKSKLYFDKLQEKNDHLNALFKEKLTGVRPIRAFGNQKMEEEKMYAADQDTFDAAILANSKINFLSPVSLIIMNWVVVVIYLVGSTQLRSGMAQISDLILIFQYISYFIATLGIVPVLVNMLPKVAVSGERINELLDYESAAAESGAVKVPQSGVAPAVEMRNVIFGYAGATDVIANVSFKIERGETAAFIGATGSGKTTIMNLVQGLYRPTFGEILIDGVPVGKYEPSKLRSKMSYATQRAQVFRDTIKNNICVFDESMTDAQIRSACDAACFSEIVDGLPDGFDTVMSPGGTNLSGGQRQRLSLARAVARDAEIYIFDDTFSALDAKTESIARKRIRERLKGKTTLMVAQKISTIMDADKIIVLDKGHIVGIGTHTELLESCEPYREIYKTQYYLDHGDNAERSGEAE